MQWNEYTIKTTTIAEDLVSDMLMELGIEGVEILDNVPLSEEDKEKLYIDILPELPEDEGIGYVKFYLDAGNPENDEAVLEQVRQGLKELRDFIDVGEGSIETGQTQDEDWINNWKAYFKSFYLDDILIKPSWEETPAENRDGIVIEIDPGTSFGTGHHETTQLCIRQLKKHMKPGQEVLDLGCGSGILSLICLKLGASHVTGTDIDEICMDASRENMERNGMNQENYRFYHGNLITDEELAGKIGDRQYDIVVANILADVIIPMAPAAYPHLREGGRFITSGIIDFKEEAVKEALVNSGFTIDEITHQGEWVNITARK